MYSRSAVWLCQTIFTACAIYEKVDMLLLVGAMYSNTVANVIETLVSLVDLNVEAKTVAIVDYKNAFI